MARAPGKKCVVKDGIGKGAKKKNNWERTGASGVQKASQGSYDGGQNKRFKRTGSVSTGETLEKKRGKKGRKWRQKKGCGPVRTKVLAGGGRGTLLKPS